MLNLEFCAHVRHRAVKYLPSTRGRPSIIVNHPVENLQLFWAPLISDFIN